MRLHLLVDWDAAAVDLTVTSTDAQDERYLRLESSGFFFRPGLTWPADNKRFQCSRFFPADAFLVIKDRQPSVQLITRMTLLVLGLS